MSPIRDAAGRVVGASKIARDIAERRRAEEQERLLLREMNHRIKNLFALASGVVTLSARSAKSAPELAEMIRDRLGALCAGSRPDLPEITGTGAKIERSTTLAALVRTVLSPYVADPLDNARGDEDLRPGNSRRSQSREQPRAAPATNSRPTPPSMAR